MSLVDDFVEKQCPTSTLWEKLALERNFELINKLRRVELGESGYGTVIVSSEGFSERDDLHNLVLDWLEEQNVNVLNVGLERARLEMALRT